MKRLFALLITTAAVSLSATSYAEESSESKATLEHKKGGGYDATQTSEQTGPGGTKRVNESETDVSVNSKGQISKTTTTESSTDPKGVMNKSKEITKTEIVEKDRGGYKQVTTSRHTDADGTNVILVTTTELEVDDKGNVTTTAQTEKTVDPKGFMNKKTTSTMSKVVNGKVVEERKKSD